MREPDDFHATTRCNDRNAWEKAEVNRSAIEARDAEAAGLRLGDYHIVRYLAPPLDTPYSLEYAFALVGDIRGQTVLDFGCGSGRGSVVLRSKGARLLALDISPHMLQVTRKRLEVHDLDQEAEYLEATGHRMPLPDCSVDLIFGAAILHHLDLAQTSLEVHRVLRPGGRAIFIEPVRDPELYRLIRRVFPNRSEDVSPFEYPLTRGQIAAFCDGFELGPSRRFQLPLTTILERTGLSERFVRPFRRLDAHLLRGLPSLRYWATIEVFQISRPGSASRPPL